MSEQLATTLSLLDRPTAERLRRARPARICWVDSRSGARVPAVDIGGRTITLHSRYDPSAEAERIAAEAQQTTICLGLGGGLHIPALAAAARSVVVVEWDAGLARAVLQQSDLSGVLESPGVSLLVAPPAAELADHLAERYRAAIDPPPVVVSLRSREAADRHGAERAREVVRQATELLKDDVAAQARFGRAWVRNALANLRRPRPPLPLPNARGRTVVVTAAGPSLEQSFTDLRHRNSGLLVIATDTSAPALVDAGVRPDLVLSIDCQIASYHHALPEAVRSLPFLLDVSAPPSLVDALSDVSFFLSSHPLSQYLSMTGLPYRRLDTRSGTVTHVAVELAAALGARRIVVTGADFAYPHGRTYVRGSYIDRLFRATANRYAGAHSRHLRFLFDRPGLAYEHETDRYTQPLLDTYRRNLQTAAAAMPIPVVIGGAVLEDTPLAVESSAQVGTPSVRAIDAGPAIRSATTRALTALRNAVASLPDSLGGVGDGHAHAAVSVITPMLTWNRARNPDMGTEELVATTRQQLLALIDRTLDGIADPRVPDE